MVGRGITIALWLLCGMAWAQNPTPDAAVLLEERLPWADGESLSEGQLEAWILAMAHPLDLNEATRADLEALQVIPLPQIDSLLAHRERYGRLVSLYELQSVAGWELDLIREVLPLVQVRPVSGDGLSLWERLRREENRYALFRYDFKGALADSLTEPTGRWLARVRVSRTRAFSLGLTLEHDVGESWRQGPDFVSGHVMGQGQGWLRQWVVGDFMMQWGQGLVTAAGFTPGKGGETVLSVRRPHRGMVPYTSSVEAGHYRGGAITVGSDQWQATALVSHLGRDATLLQADSLSEPEIRAFRTDGYHITDSEVAARRAARETTLGALLRYQSRNGRGSGGIYGMVHHWQHRWNPALRPDNPTVFRGQTLPLYGAFGEWRWHNLVVFGEGAISHHQAPAGLVGVQLHLSPAWQMAWVARHYDPGFSSVYGDAFAESSQPRNERGLYWGIAYQPHKRFQATAYFDRFQFPWLRFSTARPSEGYEALLRLRWRPQRELDVTLQARREVKDRTVTDGSATRVTTGIKDNALVMLNYRPKDALGVRIRLQGSRFALDSGASYGVALMHDVFVSHGVWSATGRVALFHAPDFENRQYAYENHVLYGFALPAYYGRGFRTYLNLRAKPVYGITLEARWARTFRLPSEINGEFEPPSQEFTFQVKYRF